MHKLVAFVLLTGFVAANWTSATEPAWKEGEHYFLLSPDQPKVNDANKIEVVEAFSYGCPACNQFLPVMERLKVSLPKGVKVEYLPASFIPSESWPLFQRAFYAAQVLHIAEKTHTAMFEAIWKTGELATIAPGTNRLKNPPPSLEDVAKFYGHAASINPADFLATAQSFGVETQMKRADQLMRAYRVDSTPTIIINGKYRLTPGSAGGFQQTIDLVRWLIAKET